MGMRLLNFQTEFSPMRHSTVKHINGLVESQLGHSDKDYPKSKAPAI